MAERVKLAGGPAKTVTWIWLERSQIKIEFYDFSETAQRMFGNDIAYTITVTEMTQVLSIANQSEATLVPWMAEHFRSYFDLKQWLEEHQIPFHVERESWA